jgi:hypothetical protein
LSCRGLWKSLSQADFTKLNRYPGIVMTRHDIKPNIPTSILIKMAATLISDVTDRDIWRQSRNLIPWDILLAHPVLRWHRLPPQCRESQYWHLQNWRVNFQIESYPFLLFWENANECCNFKVNALETRAV